MSWNLLLTGAPGVGKTTFLKKLIKESGHLAMSGFITEEIREEGRRVGFRAVALSGATSVFAHRQFLLESDHRVGVYGVRPEILEDLVLDHLNPDRKRCDLFLVDEIARMEVLSEAFKKSIWRLLDSDHPVLASVALKGTGIIKRVKKRPDVELFTLKAKNQTAIFETLRRRLNQLLAH